MLMFLMFISVLLVLPVAFYFWAVLPEFLTCNENTPSNLEAVDFW
ncbi:Uncharacterised protein [Chryseobacterium taklimakanense]|uniref:Uncharacterized protein n=1 Tax=Chryseobacterium taklimakanense TaxID=536441 RepID=A0A239WL08_9FLAO|nr:Uncharacterised protein [Chryseobacterium taklimakanense]